MSENDLEIWLIYQDLMQYVFEILGLKHICGHISEIISPTKMTSICNHIHFFDSTLHQADFALILYAWFNVKFSNL